MITKHPFESPCSCTMALHAYSHELLKKYPFYDEGKKWERKSSWWGLIGSHLWSLHHRHSPFSDKEPINVVNRQKSHLLKWNMSLQWTFLAFNYEIKVEIFVWITRQDILDNEKWISFVTARLWRCRRCCCHFLPFVCHCYCRS